MRQPALKRVPPHLLLALSLGVVCQIAQIVLLREFLVVFHGNEISMGITLGAWMLWVGIGSRVAGEKASAAPGSACLPVISGTLFLLLPATVLAIRVLRLFFPVHPGAYLSVVDMLISSFIVIAPAGVLLGAQFVFLARLWRIKNGSVDTLPAGKTYIAEAAGNALGGVLFTFVLVHLTNPFLAVMLAALLMIATGVIATGNRNRRQAHERAPGRVWIVRVGLSVALVAAVFLSGWVDDRANHLQWNLFYPDHELVSVHRSRYGTIVVARREDQYSFFQSGNLVFSTAAPGSATSSMEEQEAIVHSHLAMVQHPQPRSVLVIGGGLRGTLREIVRHPVDRVDYVELDPALTRAAWPYLQRETIEALERGEVHLIHGDARLFVKTSSQHYDLVIVDLPDPATAVLNRYYTREFFGEVAARLVPDGVLVITAETTADLRSGPVANRNATIYHTLRSVFAEVLPVGERRITFFAATAPGLLSADPLILEARFLERGIAADGFSPRQYQLLLREEPLNRMNWVIRNHGRSSEAHLAPPDTGPLVPPSIAEQEAREADLPEVHARRFINTDLRPIGYVHTVVYWNLLTRSAHLPVLHAILLVEPWWVAALVVLPVAIALGLRLRRRDRKPHPETRFSVLFAVYTTGLSTMSLQIALLFSFQSAYGFVYEMVGLIVAGFMAGLAVGTGLTHRFVRKRSNILLLRWIQLGIAVFAALIGLGLEQVIGLQSSGLLFAAFLGLTFVAGTLNGFDFPIATACCLSLEPDAERAAGLVYGVELFGACSGALIAGIVVAPVLGIVACCMLAAIGNATAFLVLAIPQRSGEESSGRSHVPG